MNAAANTVSSTTARSVIVSVRNVYGNTAIYPVCADAMNFAFIAGTKTLSAQVLAHVVALGFDVVYSGDTQRTAEAMASVARLSQGPRAGFRGVA